MQTSIGEQFKQARLARKASIEDVSRAIHIRSYFIEALEEGKFEEIPSQAQVKGFIRLYSDWLGLDTQILLDSLFPKPEISIPVQPQNLEPEKKTKINFFNKFKKESVVSDLTAKTEPIESHNRDSSVESSAPISEIETNDEIVDRSVKPQITSSILFQQIGSELKTCREKLNISVDEIEKLTHIRARYLLDMENGNFNDIPSMVQARGLLNGYATFLNIDSDQILSKFAEALQQRRIELLPPEPELVKEKKAKSTPKKERTGITRFITLDFIVGSVTIIGLVIFGTWSAIKVISTHNKTVEKPPAIADVLMQNPTSESPFKGTQTIEPTLLARNPEDIGKIPTANTNLNQPQTNESPTPPVPNLGKASMQVYIITNQRVFLQVTTGRKVAFLGRTVPGNAYPFTSDERIEVVSGDAASLQIYYNQKDLGTLGLPGEPLRLIFSKDGIATPTSAVTSAPTSTPLATLTLRPSPTSVPPTITPYIP